jgi:hypothetical protein
MKLMKMRQGKCEHESACLRALHTLYIEYGCMLQNWPLDGAKHLGLIIIREHDAIIGIMASIHTYCHSCPGGVNASVMQVYMMHACTHAKSIRHREKQSASAARQARCYRSCTYLFKVSCHLCVSHVHSPMPRRISCIFTSNSAQA